jgi:hypothetical protein
VRRKLKFAAHLFYIFELLAAEIRRLAGPVRGAAAGELLRPAIERLRDPRSADLLDPELLQP